MKGISQSMYKKIVGSNGCHYKIVREEKKPTLAMKKGLLFEYHLIGATRDGDLEPTIMTDTGKVSVHNERTKNFAIQHRKTLVDLGLMPVIAQPEWFCYVDNMIWEGHPDGILPNRGGLVDIKYTEEAATRSKWKYEDLSFTDKVQALHYTIMSKEITGFYMPFFFIVFFSWGGVEVIQAQITRSAIEDYKVSVKNAIDSYFPSRRSTSFNECVECKFLQCKSRITKPKLRKTTITGL